MVLQLIHLETITMENVLEVTVQIISQQGDMMGVEHTSLMEAVISSTLEQILLELRKEGILSSIKGAHGGYKLARDLKDITLKEVMQTLESDAFSDVCKTDNPALKLFWTDITESIDKVFEIPLSELKDYQLKANKALDFSI